MKIKFILLVLLIFLGFSFSQAQENETNLREKKISIKMEKQPLALIFRHLMQNYDIPIGFEESILDREHSDYNFETNLPFVGTKKMETPDGQIKLDISVWTVFEAKKHPITINAENATLESVLNEIVRQMENYKWEINDGVVNIYPVKGRDPRFEKLLKMNISKFSVEPGKSVRTITTNILQLPEIKAFLNENNLHFTGMRYGSDIEINSQYGRKMEAGMNFSNITFRELLNKATKVKRGGWILKWRYITKTTQEEHIDIDI